MPEGTAGHLMSPVVAISSSFLHGKDPPQRNFQPGSVRTIEIGLQAIDRTAYLHLPPRWRP
jgi:hypothetical protein